MTLKVNRFEPKIMEKDTQITTQHEKSVKIIDHTTDNIAVIVNYAKTSQTNIDIANLIIETLENYIEEQQNET